MKTADVPLAPGTRALPPSAAARARTAWLRLRSGLEAVPQDPVALLGRFSVAGVFWQSGQTKIEGLAIDLVQGRVELGWPRLAGAAVDLFRDEYRLPLIAPELAAVMAAAGEHLLPLMLLLGLGTRFAALGLLGMTLVIQVLVYPGAYATHGAWAAVLAWLLLRGPGRLSLDHLIERRWRTDPS
jgi:putative oxidoreductase